MPTCTSRTPASTSRPSRRGRSPRASCSRPRPASPASPQCWYSPGTAVAAGSRRHSSPAAPSVRCSRPATSTSERWDPCPTCTNRPGCCRQTPLSPRRSRREHPGPRRPVGAAACRRQDQDDEDAHPPQLTRERALTRACDAESAEGHAVTASTPSHQPQQQPQHRRLSPPACSEFGLSLLCRASSPNGPSAAGKDGAVDPGTRSCGPVGRA